jgi:hypothetical protein
LRGPKRNRESSRANSMGWVGVGVGGDRERAEPSDHDDPVTDRITYHIITFYRAVTLRCRAAAEAEPRTDIELRRHNNSTNARTAQTH